MTRTAVPDIPEGYYAVWAGSGWRLTTSPPPVFVDDVEEDDNSYI